MDTYYTRRDLFTFSLVLDCTHTQSIVPHVDAATSVIARGHQGCRSCQHKRVSRQEYTIGHYEDDVDSHLCFELGLE